MTASLDELLSRSPSDLLHWIHSGHYVFDGEGLNWLGLAEGATTKAHAARSVADACLWSEVVSETLERAECITSLPHWEVTLRKLHLCAALACRFDSEPASPVSAEAAMQQFLRSNPFTTNEVIRLIDISNEVPEIMRVLRRLRALIAAVSLIEDRLTDSALRSTATVWLSLLSKLP